MSPWIPLFAVCSVVLVSGCSSSSTGTPDDASSDGVAIDSFADGSAEVAMDGPLDTPVETFTNAMCGSCPSSAPVCYHVNAHDGSYIVAAECVPMPASCTATPTCDCAAAAIAASWSADAASDAGLPTCPGRGALYCDGSEGPLTIRCNPP